MENKNFRVFGPDETASNRPGSYLRSQRQRIQEPTLDTDEKPFQDRAGRGSSKRARLPGLLEGYSLTGRHGLFSAMKHYPHRGFHVQ